jgi:hypothetical protein
MKFSATKKSVIFTISTVKKVSKKEAVVVRI